MNKKEFKLYNILAPIWILIFLVVVAGLAIYSFDRKILPSGYGSGCGAGSQIGFAAGGDHCAVSVLFSVKAVVLRIKRINICPNTLCST